ncbi:MAG: alpha/beta fold hydrolase [Thermonemataceae bacterium]
MKILKLLIQIIQLVSPTVAAKRVYTLVSRPRMRKPKAHEEVVLSQAEQQFVTYKHFKLRQYSWGETTDKTALLVHGWEGRTGNFAALIPILLQKGYQVVAFDAPSHGNSSQGETHMFDFADFLAEVLSQFTPQVIISHSFGSVNTATVLRKLPSLSIRNWFLVTTPHTFSSWIEQVSSLLNLSKRAHRALTEKFEQVIGEKVSNLDMAAYCRTIQNVEKAIIIHSKTDKVLPIEGARKVHNAFKQSQMIELDRLGHYAILWSEEMKKIVAEKLI